MEFNFSSLNLIYSISIEDLNIQIIQNQIKPYPEGGTDKKTKMQKIQGDIGYNIYITIKKNENPK